MQRNSKLFRSMAISLFPYQFGSRRAYFSAPLIQTEIFQSNCFFPHRQLICFCPATGRLTSTYLLQSGHEKRPTNASMSFSATSMSPPVMVLPGLSCEPTVAIRFEPSSCEKIGWPFSPGDFSLTVDLSALRSSPLIRCSFSSLKRNGTPTSKARSISFMLD